MPNGGNYPIGPGAGPGVGIGGVPTGDVGFMGKIQKGMGSPMAKGVGLSIFADWLMNQVMQGVHGQGMRNIQKEGLRSQAEMITPESLYMQAAQPQALEEESMARQALFQHLSGGVIGPSLAKGEMMIGGR